MIVVIHSKWLKFERGHIATRPRDITYIQRIYSMYECHILPCPTLKWRINSPALDTPEQSYMTDMVPRSLPLSPGRRRWVAVKAQEFWDLLGVSRVIFYFRGWIFILTKKNFRTVVRKPDWTKASGSSDWTELDYAARASNWTELDQGLWKLGLNWTGLRCQSFELD